MATLDKVTGELRLNNAASEQRDKEQLGQLVTLNKQFEKYFKSMSASKGDDLEKEREKKEEKAPAGRGDLVAGGAAVKGSSLGVIGAALVAAGAAVVGAVAGIFRGFVDSLDLFTKGFFSKQIKRITDGITDFFKRFGGGVKTEVSFLDKGLEGFRRGVFNFVNAFKKVGTTVGAVGKEVTIVASDFKSFPARLGAAFAVFRPAFNNLQLLFNDIKGVFSKIGTVADTAKDAGGFISKIAEVAKPFFSVFQRLGRFLGGPITAFIFGVIDAFSGAMTGFEETEGSLGEKIFGGIMGAIAGFVSGFIGGILDLGKMLVGFVAGLFGFEDFKEKLASISITDFIFDSLMKLKDMVLDFVRSPLDSVKSIFGFGDDEEDAPPEVKEGNKGLQRALRKQEQARRSASGQGPQVTVTEPPPQTVLKTQEATAPGLKTKPMNDATKEFTAYADSEEGKAEFARNAAEREAKKAAMLARAEAAKERRAARLANPEVRASEIERRRSQLARNEGRFAGMSAEERNTNAGAITERRISELQDQIKFLESQGAGGGATVIAPQTTTNNNQSSSAMYGDPSPATDDLDRAADNFHNVSWVN
jgi:hypothetical protein